MSITRITDPYNDKKVWIIKHYSCGNYYYNQEVCGRKTHGFVRTTKRFLGELLYEAFTGVVA